MALVVVVVIVTSPSTPSFARSELAGRVRHVADGDSLYLASYRPQVRLWGVNAPERGERGAEAARSFLWNLTHGQRLRCEVMHRDKYGRTVARCYLPDGRDVARVMLDHRHVHEMRGFSRGYYSKR